MVKTIIWNYPFTILFLWIKTFLRTKIFVKNLGGWSYRLFWVFNVWKWGFGFGEGKKVELQINHPYFYYIFSIYPLFRFQKKKRDKK